MRMKVGQSLFHLRRIRDNCCLVKLYRYLCSKSSVHNHAYQLCSLPNLPRHASRLRVNRVPQYNHHMAISDMGKLM